MVVSLTVVRTFIMVSMCHLLFGEYLQCKIQSMRLHAQWQRGLLFDAAGSSYFSAAKKISEVMYDLNSKSALTRKVSSSFIMPRMLLEFTRAKDNSIARLKIKGNVMYYTAVCNCVLCVLFQVCLGNFCYQLKVIPPLNIDCNHLPMAHSLLLDPGFMLSHPLFYNSKQPNWQVHCPQDWRYTYSKHFRKIPWLGKKNG